MLNDLLAVPSGSTVCTTPKVSMKREKKPVKLNHGDPWERSGLKNNLLQQGNGSNRTMRKKNDRLSLDAVLLNPGQLIETLVIF